MQFNAFSSGAVLYAVLILSSCVSRRPVLEPYECGTVQRIHTLEGAFLASQPQEEDFKTAKEDGIKTVVNLRKEDELDWDEAAFVTGIGLKYHSVPFKTPTELTDEVFGQIRELLNDKALRPILLHCSSGNRVGAVWLAHRVLDDGESFEDAYQEAQTVGLKMPAYVERSKEYIAMTRKQSAG